MTICSRLQRYYSPPKKFVAPSKRVPTRDIILNPAKHRLPRATGMPLQPMGTESAQRHCRLSFLRMRARRNRASVHDLSTLH